MRKNVISYKYNYPAKKSSGLYLTKTKIRYLLIALGLFVMVSLNFIANELWLFLMMLFIVWIGVTLVILGAAGAKRLYITPRYLLCGDDIIYYRNITAIKMQEHRGLMTIETPNTILTLNRDDFPSNARKDYKIAKNKKEKFRKTSDKIIKRVKAINPKFMINAPAQHATRPLANHIPQYPQNDANVQTANAKHTSPAIYDRSERSEIGRELGVPKPQLQMHADAAPPTQAVPTKPVDKIDLSTPPELHRQTPTTEQNKQISELEQELLDFDLNFDDLDTDTKL